MYFKVMNATNNNNTNHDNDGLRPGPSHYYDFILRVNCLNLHCFALTNTDA